MNFLFDTNILVAVEPTSPEHIEDGTLHAAELVRVLNEHGHRIFLHPDGIAELQRDGNEARRRLRQHLVGKYQVLTSPPQVSPAMRLKLPPSASPSDPVDNAMLAAIDGNAAHHLVTEDRGIHHKARLLGQAERVLRVREALELLARLHPAAPEPPPAVELRLAHQLDLRDPIFASFRTDYPDFEGWFQSKAQQEQRTCWVVERSGQLAALCVVKEERAGNELGLREALKISSFKVAPEHSGQRLGEVLLRSVFQYAARQRFDHLYVTVYDRHTDLLALLETFGFTAMDALSPLNERILHKPLRPEVDPGPAPVTPLAHHLRYGPPRLPPEPPATYIVPIQPKYHRLLFPDAEPQRQLPLEESRPYANAIRKAYLCHAQLREMPAGAVVAFYQSRPEQSVAVVGVVEATMRTTEPDEIVRFVSNRTVYSLDEIETQCAEGEVLAILFRFDRVLDRPAGVTELRDASVLRRAPQSAATVRDGAAWLRERIEA